VAELKLSYGTAGQEIVITLENLASAAVREGDFVSNALDLFVDVLVMACITPVSGTPTGDKAAFIYAYGTVDNVIYSDGAGGVDEDFTLTDPTNMKLLGVVSTPTSAPTTYWGGPWSLASVFGGAVPAQWGIAVKNSTGLAFSADPSKTWVKYQGTKLQTAG